MMRAYKSAHNTSEQLQSPFIGQGAWGGVVPQQPGFAVNYCTNTAGSQTYNAAALLTQNQR